MSQHVPASGACRACGAPFDPSAAPTHCSACNAVLPPSPLASPFARLGLPQPRFTVDAAALERAWLARSRAVHPDRYAKKSAAERRAAAEQTAAINDAWRALRVPFERAVWLLHSVGVVEPKLPQQALIAFMEAREEAEDPEGRARVLTRSRARFDELMAEVAAELHLVDEEDGWSQPSRHEARLRRVAAMLAEARTVARLVHDLGGEKLIASLER